MVDREKLFPADGEHCKLQLEHFVAVLVFFGDERDFFAEGVDAFHDAVVAFLADAEGESRDVAAARRVAVDGVGGEFQAMLVESAECEF